MQYLVVLTVVLFINVVFLNMKSFQIFGSEICEIILEYFLNLFL